MKKRLKRFDNFPRVIMVAAAVFILAGCCVREEKIVIISTNDMHASIDRFPNLAALVERYRTDAGCRVLLIDAGDIQTGNPYIDMATRPGLPMVELMNALHYDMGTLGNHEFDAGIDTLAARIGQYAFQTVLANANFACTPVRGVKPYAFLTVGGVKFGFLGLIELGTDGRPAGKGESFGETVFFDPIETALGYRYLRDSCDVFIAVTHTGLHTDTLLAKRMQELDLIIGGHSHTVLAEGGLRYGNVLVTQTGSRLKYADVTTLKTRKGKIVSVENRIVALDTVPQSEKFAAIVEHIKSVSNPELATVAGSIAEGAGKTALLNLFSDIMRESTGTQFAFYNRGGMRLDTLKAGKILAGDIYAAEPFKNSPVTMRMTLEEIKELILNKFNSRGSESRTEDIYPSGMTYTIVTDGNGEGTDVIFSHPYKEGRGMQYKVAMADYISLQYDFPKRGKGVPTGFYITGLVFDYLKKNSPVTAPAGERIKIVRNF